MVNERPDAVERPMGGGINFLTLCLFGNDLSRSSADASLDLVRLGSLSELGF
jgi:hypothetical protein